MEDNSKKPKYPERPPPQWVRCLGSIEEEHYFWNDGTPGHRKCAKCRTREKNSVECGGIRIVKDPGE